MKPLALLTRWKGTVGPNVWLRQIAMKAMERGIHPHLITPWRDEVIEELERAGCPVHVVEGLDWVPKTVNPMRMAGYLQRAAAKARQVAEVLSNIHAAALCINGLNMPLMPRAGRRAGCAVTVVMHGARLSAVPLANRLFFALQQPAVDRYLTVVEASAAMLRRAGVPGRKIVCIPNGVDTRRFSPAAPDAGLLREFGLRPGEPVLGAVSHLEPRKGLLDLVETMGLLVRQFPDVRCLIVGTITDPADEPYAAAVRRRIEQLGLGDRVRLLGRRSDVPRLLRLMQVLVHPSRTEACPYSVLEAQAAGVPVVGFRVGGMAEVVEHGVTGLLAAPGDPAALAEAVAALLADPQRRRQFSQAARTRALTMFDAQANLSYMLDAILSAGRCATGAAEAP